MIYALVPARGGSKRVPNKNIKDIAGHPLIWWVLSAAQESIIDRIFVATDSDKIKDVVNDFGFSKVEVIGRSGESATDGAKAEVVMEEFCLKYDFDNLMVLQPTSPLLTWYDIDRTVRVYREGKYDSILPLVWFKKFLWQRTGDKWLPINYDKNNRPMHQDFSGFFVENGYVYLMSRAGFLENKCRLFGDIGEVVFDGYTVFEPDSEYEWELVETLLKEYGDIH